MKKPHIPLFLECTPMTPQMVCICCHAVRYCKGCSLYLKQSRKYSEQ